MLRQDLLVPIASIIHTIYDLLLRLNNSLLEFLEFILSRRRQDVKSDMLKKHMLNLS